MQNKKLIKQILAVALWVTVWFILAKIVNNKLLLASPVDTLLALGRLLLRMDFYTSVLGSLERIMLGFLLGTLMASVMAILAHRSELAELIISPLVSLCKSVPVAAFAVILLIWWGPRNLSFVISMIIVIPVVYSNLLEGIRSTDIKLLEMAVVFGISRRNRLKYIYRPSLKPFILSAIKSAIGMSWKAGVAAEVIGLSSNSVGGQLYTSKVYFETAEVFAWALVTIVLSFASEKFIVFVAKKLLTAKLHCSERKHAVIQTVEAGNKMDDDSIKIAHLSKSYGDKTLYEDFSASYAYGEEYTISDRSGSGKTTLLHMIAGLVEADRGSIQVNGNVSMVFQEDRLCEDYSAVTNVAITGIGEARARQALEQILDKDSLDKPCRELSGGMKRRVAIVRAMEYPSDILLMDEPFTGMDEDTIGRVKQYMTDRKQSRTVIVATHIL